MTNYVINNELTADAQMAPELIKKCTFNVGEPSKIRINESEAGVKSIARDRDYYQKFMEVSYPNGQKSSSMIIPSCVMHHEYHDYFGKGSIYVGIPQAGFVRELQLKLSATGTTPLFNDRKILSDANYWWVRCSFLPAAEGKEYIRMIEGDDEFFYGSFSELFADYPTSMLANITCTIKLKADTPVSAPLTGKETWRAALIVSMFTPYDSIRVDAPGTGIAQRSVYGKKDVMKPGLAKFKGAANSHS